MPVPGELERHPLCGEEAFHLVGTNGKACQGSVPEACRQAKVHAAMQHMESGKSGKIEQWWKEVEFDQCHVDHGT